MRLSQFGRFTGVTKDPFLQALVRHLRAVPGLCSRRLTCTIATAVLRLPSDLGGINLALMFGEPYVVLSQLSSYYQTAALPDSKSSGFIELQLHSQIRQS